MSKFSPSRTSICWNLRELISGYTLPCPLRSSSFRPFSVPTSRLTPDRTNIQPENYSELYLPTHFTLKLFAFCRTLFHSMFLTISHNTLKIHIIKQAFLDLILTNFHTFFSVLCWRLAAAVHRDRTAASSPLAVAVSYRQFECW